MGGEERRFDRVEVLASVNSVKVEVIRPRTYLRPFDVMAEMKRQEYLEKSPVIDEVQEEDAKAYGLWAAKCIAARKFSKLRAVQPKRSSPVPLRPKEPLWLKSEWTLNGAPVKPEDFDREIVQRMGEEFYAVFSADVAMLRKMKKNYNAIKIILGSEYLKRGIPLYRSWLQFLGRSR